MIKLICLLLCVVTLFSQNYSNLEKLEAKEFYDNVKVIPLNSDDQTSTFLIFVKKEVKAHIHEHHTETIFVISGSAKMIIGKEEYQIKKGDYLYIPKMTRHSVVVTSMIPLKVLSNQSPKFVGKDRVFVD